MTLVERHRQEDRLGSGSTRTVWLILTGVFLLGLGLRLPGIGASLWLDEFSTLWVVESRLADVITRVPLVNAQTPFYFSIAWASVKAFGESELALRLPSLLAATGTAVVVGLAAATLGGRKAGAWSASLFWLAYPAIWASVNARPYPLAMFFAAVATLGFVRTSLIARPIDRALWVVGAAGTVWAHFIFTPFVLAFPAAYCLSRAIRERYPIRRFLADAFAILLLLVPAAGQLVAVVAKRESLQWMYSPNSLGIIGLFAPFVLAALMPTQVAHPHGVRRDLRLTLWLSVIGQVAALEMAWFAIGLGLMSTPYASVIIVPLAVLAGVNIAQLKGADLIGPAAVFVLITAGTLYATRIVLGSFSGAGYEQWREAVATLRPELERAANAPVLFRSGNAEDDLAVGELRWGATLAPLRSPGQPDPNWNIVLLTYRWLNASRPRYFEEGVAPRLADQPVFFMLCLGSAEPGANEYCASVKSWIAQKWPGRFRAVSLGFFNQLVVMRFDRVPARLDPGPPPPPR